MIDGTDKLTPPSNAHRHQIARDDFVTHYSHSVLTLYDSFKATATRDPNHLFLVLATLGESMNGKRLERRRRG